MRVSCCYGVTDRHGADGAKAGLAENERFLRDGGRGMVGVARRLHCSDDTLDAAAGLAADLGVGVHIHVAEGLVDSRRRRAPRRAWPTTTGCSSTASTSTATCPARSPTTPART